MSKRQIKVIFPAEALIGKQANLRATGSRRYGVTPCYVGYQRATGPRNYFAVRVRNSSKVPSASQIETQTKFRVSTTTARQWLADMEKQPRILQYFRKQANTVSGYGTMAGFTSARILQNMSGTTAPEFNTVFPALS